MPSLEPDPIHHRLAALSVCACLFATGVCPSVALAAPSDAADPPDPADPSNAEAIFRRGQAKYETADYSGAIELWTEAYALIDSTPENASIKALLIYNLAQAHAKAYELDGDLIHLKQAKQLLTSFRNNLELLYEDQSALAEETARVDESLADIEAQLAEATAEPEPEPEPPPPTIEEPIQDEPLEPIKPGKPLIGAGAALLGLGVAGGAVAIIGGVMGSSANDVTDVIDDPEARAEQFASGRTGNTLLLVGAISAGVLIPTGAALIAVGATREKQRNAQGSAAASLRVSPNFAGSWGHGAGLTFSGRF